MKLQEIFSKYASQIYALMRIVVGILFFSHGYQKVTAMINGSMPTSDVLALLSAIIEFVGGLMIITGYRTFWGAFIAAGEMAVAYFKVHQPGSLWPIDNGGEKAVFYCFVFLFIAAFGSGIWSLDSKMRKK